MKAIDWKEIYVRQSATNGVYISFIIPKVALTNEVQRYRGGYYYASNDNVGCSINVSQEVIYQDNFFLNGTNMVTTSNIDVYYR